MSKIVKIESLPIPDYVYDPVCEGPHSYVSNGIISHNCDEVDKGLGGIGSGGDSGVSSRVLGTFLTWMQDCTAPVMVVMTANNVTGLPPELLRRGRFDALFSATLPVAKERLEVLAIHLRLRGRNIADFPQREVGRVIESSAGYVPAEIESAVKDALVDAFSNEEELTMKHVYKALKAMVPLSKAFSTQIEAMQLWAENNATPASKPEFDETAEVKETRRVMNRVRRPN